MLVLLRAVEVIPAMMQSITALKELFWVSCLMWGILLTISAVTEGVPYTSIAIRNEFWQDAIGSIGLFWLCLAYTSALTPESRGSARISRSVRANKATSLTNETPSLAPR
jgi:hypothetical protein